MKVLLVNTLYYPNIVGGAERSVQVFAESLVESGHEVSVICLSPSLGTNRAVVHEVTVYYVGIKNLYWPFDEGGNQKLLKPFWHGFDMYNVLMSYEVGRIIDQVEPDVVHTNNLAGFSVAVWNEIENRSLPLVHTIRDYYLLCPRVTMFKHKRNCKSQCLVCRIFALPKKKCSGSVKAVVGNSQYILNQHLENGYFSNSIIRKVIFNAYAIEPSSTKNRRHLRKVLRFGYLGQLKPEKGVDTILEVQKIIATNEIQIWLAGTGNIDYVKFLKKCYESPNIVFLGFVDPTYLFRKIDVLLVPSLWHDPLPRVIFEAYMYGLPVIGSNRGGIPEIIEEGKTGFIFNPDKRESLEKSMIRFVEQPNIIEKMRPTILEKAKKFVPKKLVKQYENIYEEVTVK